MNDGWQSGVSCVAIILIQLCISPLSMEYAHILDEDRKINAQKFESSFYSNPDLRKVRAPEETQPAVDVATLIQQLQNLPELATALAALLPRPS